MTAAGATDARPFQSNGTLVFSAAEPEAVIAALPGVLVRMSGLEREAFAVPLPLLREIVAAHEGKADIAHRELTLHAGSIADADPARLASLTALGRCAVVDSGPGWTVMLNERPRESNATRVLERLTGQPATSRGLPTLVRLLASVSRD